MTEEIRNSNSNRATRRWRTGRCAFSAAPDENGRPCLTSTEPEFLEQDLTYLGLSGMIDPVRPEVKAAIVECREAGIRPDHDYRRP